jgi:hypothetical protein
LIAPQIKTTAIIAPSPKFWSIGTEMLSFAKLVFDFFIKK